MLPLGFGVNVFGFLSGNFGLGITARNYIRLLQAYQCPVWMVDILEGSERSVEDVTHPEQTASLNDAAPYPINFFFMNPGDLERVIGVGPRSIRTQDRINVCMPFWELSSLPQESIGVLDAFDIVLAGSRFNYQTYAQDLSQAMVRYFPHPLYIDSAPLPDRERWGIPPESMAFLMSFDMASDFNRKNPLGTIGAFEAAFDSTDDVCLVIKLNNTRLNVAWTEHVERLVERSRSNSSIIVVDEELSYAEVLSLYQSCDVFVSLHRAEGLGLCLMEAMALGKPVIATSWSGNMEFMDDRNSCLVGYRFIEVNASTQEAYARDSIPAGSQWADPDLDQAAIWMRTLATDRTLCKRIGERAAADMAERQGRLSPEPLLGGARSFRALHPSLRLDPSLGLEF